MADTEKLYRVCPECSGTGILVRRNFSSGSIPSETEVPCPNCNGEKVILWGELSGNIVSTIGNILDKCNNIFDKCEEILEGLPGGGHGGG